MSEVAAELQCIRDPVVTSYTRGDPPWFVQFYDRATAAFYAGSGANVWTAIAWAFDEYLTRGLLGITRGARNTNERPGDFYRERLLAPARPKAVCFDNQITEARAANEPARKRKRQARG